VTSSRDAVVARRLAVVVVIVVAGDVDECRDDVTPPLYDVISHSSLEQPLKEIY